MKLNKSRSILVGLAFMTISSFWVMYDSVIPLILKGTFNFSEVITGYIMSIDNVLALFMLPLFGMLSDKTNTRIGKRMPYVVFGTIAAVILIILLSYFNNQDTLVPFVVVLGLLLIAMSVYRSPAVALMPDVTPKPLLSKGNAVINLMGTVGGILALLAIGQLSPKVGHNYFNLFVSIAAFMVLGVAILFFTIKENKCREENPDSKTESGDDKSSGVSSKLPRDKAISLVLILGSIFLWFMGYNAVTTAYSRYAVYHWGMENGLYAYALMVAQGAALLWFIPVGMIATKIGRKKTIIIGIGMLAAAFIAVSFFPTFNVLILVLFALAGMGWATINVNSYPMVVALSKGHDVGRYTGYYYFASMGAQIATPILSGYLLEHVGYWTLFPYAGLFVVLSAGTFLFVKHGDIKPVKLNSKLEAFDVED
ncbi:MAG: MFS transporter [Clostridia bacterium]|nr:MFS transporter [Clostridia bacterium]